MTIRIDPAEVHAAADTLASSATSLETVGSSLGRMAGVTQPEVLNGLETFGITWTAALEVLADDIDYVAQRAHGITDLFVATSGALADVATDPDAIAPE